MTDNHLSPFCLVEGEYTSIAFPVKISSADTTGDLKNLIVSGEQAPAFKDIASKDLTLWRVSIPIVKDQVPILLNNVADEDKEELGPATRLSKVFPEKLPEEKVHIIVQRPSQGLISEGEFVRFVPTPIVGDQQIPGPGTSSSHRSTSVTPTVRFWEGFKGSVRGMALDPTPQYRRPQFKENRVFRPEISLQELFMHDLGSVKLLPPFADTTRIMGLRRGIPDLVCMRVGGNANEPESVLFPVEIKRPIILQSRNLVTDYNEQEQSGAATGPARALKQTFGYMRLNGYRYGVLSTYEQTWFLKRVAQGSKDILVSPTIAFDSTEPTLLQCYLWFIREAHNDQEWTLDPPNDLDMEAILEDENPPDDRREQEDSQLKPRTRRGKMSIFSRIKIKTRSNSRTTTRLVLPAFDSMELISHDERAQTYKASWQGCKVVVKKCDIWNQGPVAKELKHEARVYQVLRTLQGRYIPELKIAGVADGMEMVLVTDFVGSDVSHERLDDSDQGKIRAALSAIHDLGVVHGDIRPQNILVQHDGPNARFYFVDFGLSRITADKTALLQETAILNSLLRDMSAARS